MNIEEIIKYRNELELKIKNLDAIVSQGSYYGLHITGGYPNGGKPAKLSLDGQISRCKHSSMITSCLSKAVDAMKTELSYYDEKIEAVNKFLED